MYRWIDFPLIRGKKWSFSFPVFKTRSLFGSVWLQEIYDAEVIGPVAQHMNTPAGSFNVIKIRGYATILAGMDLTLFYSPETKSVVKLTSVQKGLKYGGEDTEMELIEYGHEAPTVKAPVVKAPTFK